MGAAKHVRLFKLLVVLLSSAAMASACTSAGDIAARPSDEAVRIASFNFAESELLAEIYAQPLEARDVPVVRLGVVGPREVVAPALELGRIDLVPEYVGTAAEYFGAAGPEIDSLRVALATRGLLALTPSMAEDVNAFVVTEETAERDQLRAVSDLAEFALGMRFGGPVECPDRPLCLLGLGSLYGVTFAEFVPQRSQAVTAEALLRDEIQVGLMFSTAAELSSGPFVVLDDDRGLQPPENVVPIVTQAAADRWGNELADALDAVSGKLTTANLQEMNRRVDSGESVADVAASWLESVGLGGN